MRHKSPRRFVCLSLSLVLQHTRVIAGQTDVSPSPTGAGTADNTPARGSAYSDSVTAKPGYWIDILATARLWVCRGETMPLSGSGRAAETARFIRPGQIARCQLVTITPNGARPDKLRPIRASADPPGWRGADQPGRGRGCGCPWARQGSSARVPEPVAIGDVRASSSRGRRQPGRRPALIAAAHQSLLPNAGGSTPGQDGDALLLSSAPDGSGYWDHKTRLNTKINQRLTGPDVCRQFRPGSRQGLRPAVLIG